MPAPEPLLSSFIGRESELLALAERVEQGRLVTLCGPGGMGKTRLARELMSLRARDAQACFVDLSQAETADAVVAAIAGALRIERAEVSFEGSMADAVGYALAEESARSEDRALWVLDNAEQLAAALGPLLTEWLARAPSLRLLITSRCALDVDGEHVFTLGPLDASHASALFVDRALRVSAEQAFDHDTVKTIVEAIDRMPLAIELAASRTRALSARDLLERLRSPLPLLRSPRPGQRHGSLRRVIEDSIALLDPASARLFALASVLRNGFTLADLEATLGAEAGGDTTALDHLESWVRASLMWVRAHPGDHARYGMLETIRHVATELAAEEPHLEEARQRHASHYAERARRGAAEPRDEADNLLAAHATCLRLPAHASDALAIACALEPWLSLRGRVRLRQELFDASLVALLEADSPDPADCARAHLGRGAARRDLGLGTPARSDFADALEEATAGSLDGLAAVALTRLGSGLDVAGDTRGARAHLEQALALLSTTPSGPTRQSREAEAWLSLGHALRREGLLDEAAAAVRASVERYRRLQRDEGLALALYELSVLELFGGSTSKTMALFDEGLALARRTHAPILEGAFTTARGCLLQDMGQLAQAKGHHARAARLFGTLGSHYREASALHYLATTYIEQGEPAEALSLLAQARGRIAKVGAPRYEALIGACEATAQALSGNQARAVRAITEAESRLALVPDEPSLRTAVAVHRAIVEIHAERPQEEAVAAMRPRVTQNPSDDTRFALRVLCSLGEPRLNDSVDVLQVWPGATRFRAPGAETPTELPDDSPLARILLHLVTTRVEAAGEGSPIDRIVQAGWPGEKIGAEAALNRAYVALSKLRKRGLREILVRSSDGYAISQSVLVRWMDPSDLNSR